MSLLPITLGVKRTLDAQQSGAAKPKRRKPLSKAEFSKLVQQTFEKDSYTCCYCGFQSRQFQKAIPKDWAVTDPRDSEMVTACIFCEQCFNLENVGPMASGTLIWLPEISQASLHHMMRAVYACRAQIDIAPEDIKNCADRAFEVLFNRRGEAKRRIGTDDPMVLAAALLENIKEETFRSRDEKIKGIRLMPLDKRMIPSASGKDNDQFPRIIEYWVSDEGPLGNLPPDTWPALQASITKAA
ncbi:MAG: type IV secretion protein DotN [Alphaproteobacteria bacterium]|nr:type IV secretion protein DotN [Alphaproteobacteria bacterium]